MYLFINEQDFQNGKSDSARTYLAKIEKPKSFLTIAITGIVSKCIVLN